MDRPGEEAIMLSRIPREVQTEFLGRGLAVRCCTINKALVLLYGSQPSEEARYESVREERWEIAVHRQWWIPTSDSKVELGVQWRIPNTTPTVRLSRHDIQRTGE